MLDLPEPGDPRLDLLTAVVADAVEVAPRLGTGRLMVVGAHARDILHWSLGHTFPTRATRDIDLAIALSAWDDYQTLSDTFPRIGTNGICHRIGEVPVDLLAFGEVEDPEGTVTPPARGEGLSVWAFSEIYATSLPLSLDTGLSVRIPTVAGYAAAKLGAWLDRSAWGELKDARDLALALYWYADSASVQDRLYKTEEGQAILQRTDLDVRNAAAHLLGGDIAITIGQRRLGELLQRWSAADQRLIAQLTVEDKQTWSPERRATILAALTAGLTAA